MYCKYCGKSGNFVKAHSIPEAFFRELRDGTTNPLLITASPNLHPKRAPIGVYDEGMLCEECEPLFAVLDDYGIQVLLKDFAELFTPVSLATGIVASQSVTIDQQALLRFLVAILWRASVSNHSFYARVKLGPFENLAKSVVQKIDDPIPSAFGAVLSFWAADNEYRHAAYPLMDPFPERWDGINAYRIYFGKIIAYVRVDNRQFRNPLADAALLAKPVTTIVGRNISNSSDLAAMTFTAVESFKNKSKRRSKGAL